MQRSRELLSQVGKLQFDIIEVKDKAMLREWFEIQAQIFTDPTDLEPWELIVERFNDKERNQFTLLRDRQTDEWAGMRLLQFDPNIPGVAYCPWGGVTEAYRNNGIYPVMAKLTLAELAERGVFIATADIEDKERIATAYPETPEEAVKIATARENFFRRGMGYQVIANNGEGENRVEYIRPPSEEGREYTGIQAYDLLAYYIDPAKEAEAQAVLCPNGEALYNHDRTGISKAAYRTLYLSMAQLQYGALPEAELRSQYKALDTFLAKLDNSPQQFFELSQGAIRPKVTADAKIDMAVKKPQQQTPAM